MEKSVSNVDTVTCRARSVRSGPGYREIPYRTAESAIGA